MSITCCRLVLKSSGTAAIEFFAEAEVLEFANEAEAYKAALAGGWSVRYVLNQSAAASMPLVVLS